MSVNVRAVVFDLGGVISPFSHERFDKLAAFCGAARDVFEPAFWRHRQEYDRGTLPADEYWKTVAVGAGFAFDPSRVETWVQMETNLWTIYDEGVLAYASTLRANGWTTGLLSNLPPAMGAELRATPGLLDPFDHLTFSFELGVAKPQPEIYRHCCRGLEIEPHEALFLDDRPDNVEGSRAVGMHAELYTTWEDFVERVLPRYALPPTDEARRG